MNLRSRLSVSTMCAAAIILASVITSHATPPVNARTTLHIPDIPGYMTLKCDFHMHTVFSDGSVWPTVRVQEAWRNGLDAISITDHIEYQPHKTDIPTNHNQPYEIARSAAENVDIILIRGGEITRSMPPGHINAIFIENADSLDRADWREAVKNASEQGAFIFYNHPGFPDPKGNPLWGPDHESLYKDKFLHGIEVVNSREYYSNSQQWCLEKKLTMIASSDQHSPIEETFDVTGGDHRPVTLVFAKKRTPEAIREALFAHRTAAWTENTLIGEEKYLRPIFDGSCEVTTPKIAIKGKGSAYVQIRNDSDVTFELTGSGESEFVTGPASVTLHAGKTVIMQIRAKSADVTGLKHIRLPYTVKNILVAPGKGLESDIAFDVRFLPVDK